MRASETPAPRSAPSQVSPVVEEARQPGLQAENSGARTTSFAGTTEVLWLVAIGLLSLGAFITCLVEGVRHSVMFVMAVVTCIFGLPLVLIVVATILAVVVQIFTPGGGKGIPLFTWKGGVDGLSPEQVREFEAKPKSVRFAKVYLWLAVNSLVGAVITLVAFGGLYMFMQFVQQRNH